MSPVFTFRDAFAGLSLTRTLPASQASLATVLLLISLEIQFGSKNVRVEVLDVQETVKKEAASELFKYL